MTRLNVMLALALMACAMLLINAQHHARKNFVELERLKGEARGLDEQWGKLRLEQSTWASAARVEAVARKRLGLITPPMDHIRVESVTSR